VCGRPGGEIFSRVAWPDVEITETAVLLAYAKVMRELIALASQLADGRKNRQ
jgi:hypothetical protein